MKRQPNPQEDPNWLAKAQANINRKRAERNRAVPEPLKVVLPTPPGRDFACPVCGEIYAREIPKSGCPQCAEERREKAAREENRIRSGRAVFGMRGWETMTFEKFVLKPGTEAALRAAENFDPGKNGIYIWGKSAGTGKTHLAYAAARRWYERGKKVSIHKPPELFRMCRGAEAGEEIRILENLSEVEVLVIDDLGVGRATEFANQIIYEILDKRIMNYRQGLIVTSNLSLDEMARKTEDDKLTSRLFQLCKIVENKGKDARPEHG